MNNSVQVFAGGWDQLQHAKLKSSTPLALTNPRGIDWSLTGDFMDIIDTGSGEIVEYSASTSWDSSSISKTGEIFDIAPLDAAPGDLHWARDGMHLYFFGEGTKTIFQLNALIPFRIAGMTYTGVFFAPVDVTKPMTGGFVMGDEKKFYVITANSDNMIFAYAMPSKGDLANSVMVNMSADVSATSSNIHAITMHPSERQMFLLGNSGDKVDRYILTTRGDPFTAVFVDTLYVGNEETLPFGMSIRPTDGKKLYVIGILSDDVHEYDMSLFENNSIITPQGEEITTEIGDNLVVQ